MGTKPAPPFANIFMARNIDNKIRKVAEKYMENGEIPLRFMKRFLDNIFRYFLALLKSCTNSLKKFIKFIQI